MNRSAKILIKIFLGITIAVVTTDKLSAQHRGDNLGYQGLANLLAANSGYGIGSGFSVTGGDVRTIFSNPAALTTLKGFQANLSMQTGEILWRENQEYRPNRLFVTLPFYLEGLYVPDPAMNDSMDYDIALDSNYVVIAPVLGKGKYTKAAADWQREVDSKSGNGNMSIGLPVQIGDKTLSVAAGYSVKPFDDYDRNATYLAPHLGYSEYDMAQRVDGTDTLTVYWYDYARERSGTLSQMTFAAAFQLTDNLSLGYSFETISGETDDKLLLDRVGYFNLADENEFSFSYDTLTNIISGQSNFGAARSKVSAFYQDEIFNLGLAVTLPSTITREWTYKYNVSTADTSIDYHENLGRQKSELEIPATILLGVSIQPHTKIKFLLDAEFAKYSQKRNEFALQVSDSLELNSSGDYYFPLPDSTNRNWPDQSTVNFGLEYTPFDNYLSVLMGYHYQTQAFIPDGQAYTEQGPASERYSLGLRLNLLKLGRFECVYSSYQLKFYDSYYSNTNYSFQSVSNLFFNYSVSL